MTPPSPAPKRSPARSSPPASIRKRVLRWVRAARWRGISTKQIGQHFDGEDRPQIYPLLDEMEAAGEVVSVRVRPHGQVGRRWFAVEPEDENPP